MSREREEKEPREIMPGAPPVQMQMSSDVFLKPVNAPKEFKTTCFFKTSDIAALGSYQRPHVLYQVGSGWEASWVIRIDSDILEKKIQAGELLDTTVCQTSRSTGRGTEQALLTQTVRVEERKQEPKSPWYKFLWR
jgi:hypothetical protein